MLNVERDGSVLRLTLSRPDVRNAFNAELISHLTDAFSELPHGVRAIVLAGEGPAFCAGGDMNWMRQAADQSDEENYLDALKLARLFETMSGCPAPIIARVHGAAFGGGCGLVAASDVAVAGEQALFSFSEVRLGLVAATISSFAIQKIGHGHARALFVTGEAFGPQKALQIGLVHEVVPGHELDRAVQVKVSAILAAGPQAVADSKRLAQASPMSPEDSARLLARVRAGAEAREGIAAFLERRAPSFKSDR